MRWEPYSRFGGKAKLAILSTAIVAVIASVSATMYLLPSDRRGGCDPCPIIVLGSPARNPGNVTVNVTATAPSYGLQSFTVTLSVDGVPRARLSPLSNASDWVLSFLDHDGDGRLGAGDQFRIDTVAAGEYELSVLYGDYLAARASWAI